MLRSAKSPEAGLLRSARFSLAHPRRVAHEAPRLLCQSSCTSPSAGAEVCHLASASRPSMSSNRRRWACGRTTLALLLAFLQRRQSASWAVLMTWTAPTLLRCVRLPTSPRKLPSRPPTTTRRHSASPACASKGCCGSCTEASTPPPSLTTRPSKHGATPQGVPPTLATMTGGTWQSKPKTVNAD